MSFYIFFQALDKTFSSPIFSCLLRWIASWLGLIFLFGSVGMLASLYLPLREIPLHPIYSLVIIATVIFIGFIYFLLKILYHFMNKSRDLIKKKNNLEDYFQDHLSFRQFCYLCLKIGLFKILSVILFALSIYFSPIFLSSILLLFITFETFILRYFFCVFLFKSTKAASYQKYKEHFLMAAFFIAIVSFIPILNLTLPIFGIVLMMLTYKNCLSSVSSKNYPNLAD